MIYRVSHHDRHIRTEVTLPASKSLSNRALIIQKLCKAPFSIHNLSGSSDTVLLKQLLDSDDEVLDCHDAGTTLRFLTAFVSLQGKKRIITGTSRMKQRPIGDLVEALNDAGAEITYIGEKGFPPLSTGRKKPSGGQIEITGNISSQFISALLLIAPVLKKGIDLEITGEILSRPYIGMTVELMKKFSVICQYNDHHIRIEHSQYAPADYTVEPDWSAASYWYEIAALSVSAEIVLKGLPVKSLQGDSTVAGMMEKFGVFTVVKGSDIVLHKKDHQPESHFEGSFEGCPDLAQTIACTCAGLGVAADLKGLQSLRIKESNRAEALQRELYNLNVQTDFCDRSKLKIYNTREIKSTGRTLKTHHDHRMAMSLAPLALKLGFADIENPEVVAKSYPDYWNDLKSAGFVIEER